MSIVGKVVARIDEREYESLIVFIDGTALSVDGHMVELSPTDLRKLAREDQGKREKQRLRRLRRMEWLSVSCDERVRRREEREARLSPFARAVEGMTRDMILSEARILGLSGFKQTAIRCPHCHEFACENAVKLAAA